MDDNDEFNAVAVGTGAKETEKPSLAPQARCSGEIISEDSSAEVVHKNVQYTLFGPGFLPSGKSVPALPPGIYELVDHNDHMIFAPSQVVSDDLLRLPDSRSEMVVQEIETFWTLKERFKTYGFTHKRGYLLFGPPGSGKTSTIKIVMNEMVKAGGIVLMMTVSPSLFIHLLHKLRQVEPDRPVVVIMEDVDTIISNFGESEVLSLLDGEASIDNCVFLATTNYPDRLDGRVVNRPSRFDRVVKIGLPNAEARKVYLRSRLPKMDDLELQTWVDSTKEFSIAHIKELIVGVCCFGNPFDREVDRLKKMSVVPSSEDSGTVGFASSKHDFDDYD